MNLWNLLNRLFHFFKNVLNHFIEYRLAQNITQTRKAKSNDPLPRVENSKAIKICIVAILISVECFPKLIPKNHPQNSIIRSIIHSVIQLQIKSNEKSWKILHFPSEIPHFPSSSFIKALRYRIVDWRKDF